MATISRPDHHELDRPHSPKASWCERRFSIGAIGTELRLDDLVANRTMSRDIAETLREIAGGRRSFIVLAVPRLAGKSTVLRAILAERPGSSPVLTLAEDGQDLDELVKKSAGGYLVIPEITQSAAMPGYIWGADVCVRDPSRRRARRCFRADLQGLRGARRRCGEDRVRGPSAFDRPMGGADTPRRPIGSRDRRRRGR